MFQRNQIEKLLKLNGVPLESPDEEIKSILISAQWNKDDIEAAILILRGNKYSHETRVASVHNILCTDQRLQPDTISSLLGIDMNITSDDIELRYKRSDSNVTISQIMVIAGFSLTLSFTFIYIAMWYLKIGIFYPAFV